MHNGSTQVVSHNVRSLDLLHAVRSRYEDSDGWQNGSYHDAGDECGDATAVAAAEKFRCGVCDEAWGWAEMGTPYGPALVRELRCCGKLQLPGRLRGGFRRRPGCSRRVKVAPFTAFPKHM